MLYSNIAPIRSSTSTRRGLASSPPSSLAPVSRLHIATLYTIRCTPYAAHYTLHTIHYALYTIHFMQHTLSTIHHTVYTIHYTVYTIHYAPSAIHFTPSTTHYTLYTIHYTTVSMWHDMMLTLTIISPTTFSENKTLVVERIPCPRVRFKGYPEIQGLWFKVQMVNW